jgi:hypothetical protein
MVTASFRFYEDLNDFLAPDRRRREFSVSCARAATTKHMIEALGVPHTEVELILVNGASVGFDRILCDGDRVSVYPKFESFDVTSLLRVRAAPLRVTRFVADAHLGGLAHLLRMMGFDTLYRNSFGDDEIVALATTEDRIILTRDLELLKRPPGQPRLLRACREAGAATARAFRAPRPRRQCAPLQPLPRMQHAIEAAVARSCRRPRAGRSLATPTALQHLRTLPAPVLGRFALAANARSGG